MGITNLKPRPKLDIPRLVNDLGGVASAHLRFAHLGVEPPTENAIRLWVYRNRMPGDWIGGLLMVLGASASQYAYIPDEEEENEEEDLEDFDPFGEELEGAA